MVVEFLTKVKNYILYLQATDPFENLGTRKYPRSFYIEMETELGKLTELIPNDRFVTINDVIYNWFVNGDISEIPVPLCNYVKITKIW